MVSIRDVAKHAGVSISTVSKVVNNYPNVSVKTKDKVNASIKELNFIPNTIASTLSSKHAGRVALLMDMDTQIQAYDEISMKYLFGAMNQCREMKLDVVTLFYSMISDKSTEEMEQYFRSQSIVGIILYGMGKHDESLQKLVERQIFKMVVVDAPFVNTSTSCIGINHRKAQRDVAYKTIQDNAGNRSERILYIAGKEEGYVTGERLDAMYELALDEKLTLTVCQGQFSESKAREIVFEHAKDQDIIVCASDLMAIGAMKALMEMDIFRPVCGFDGLTLMGYAGKQMNTVKQDFAFISSEAVKELARLMDDGEGREILLPHEIVRIRYEDIIK